MTLNEIKKQYEQNIIKVSRQKCAKINDYINQTLDIQKSLDYELNEYFETDELFEVLIEDLPEVREQETKVYFINDIVDIANSFFKITKSKKIRLQLQVVKTDMCRLFHVDNIKQRLLCTYHGPGTEYIEDKYVNRHELGKGDNEKIIKNRDKVSKLNEYDLIILRGLRYNHILQGAVHRSPPLTEELNTRIVLKIDEL